MKPLDKDRKMGIVLIILVIISWSVAANTHMENLRIAGTLAGLVFFLWVLGLMGKSIDEHGWADAPKDDDDEDKKGPF